MGFLINNNDLKVQHVEGQVVGSVCRVRDHLIYLFGPVTIATSLHTRWFLAKLAPALSGRRCFDTSSML